MDTMTHEMRDVKVEEVSGKALSWVTARALGLIEASETLDDVHARSREWWFFYEPESDWGQGGQIIQTQRISLSAPGCMGGHWSAHIDTGSFGGSRYWFGDTALVAACRALTGTALGDTVSVPAALLEVA